VAAVEVNAGPLENVRITLELARAVATIDAAPPTRTFFAYQSGNPAVGIQVFRANGANVLATLDAVKAAVAELRAGALKAHGLGIEQSFDASLFIRRAVHLLSENLIVGALLALVVVWWFMRQWRVTLLIATTIPVCLCATFVTLDLFGRSLNLISLAGLAFAVGMVVEGAIVVSGNVVRLPWRRQAARGGRPCRLPAGRRRAARLDRDHRRGVPGADDLDRSGYFRARRSHSAAGRPRLRAATAHALQRLWPGMATAH
jgi:multidrug efflux pump subunit AcrB